MATTHQGGSHPSAADLLTKPALSVLEFATVLGIGKNSAYSLIRLGQVRVLRVGTRIVIPTSAIRELLGDS